MLEDGYRQKRNSDLSSEKASNLAVPIIIPVPNTEDSMPPLNSSIESNVTGWWLLSSLNSLTESTVTGWHILT